MIYGYTRNQHSESRRDVVREKKGSEEKEIKKRKKKTEKNV